MSTTYRVSATFSFVAVIATLLPNSSLFPDLRAADDRDESPVLWIDRGDVRSLDLIGGPGGKEHQPSGKFTFDKDDMGGTSPKFIVRDEEGVRWKAKLGPEVKSETAATRLVWAAGYFTDEDYYLPEMHVENMAKLKRGGEFVSADGTVKGVRMERYLKGVKKDGNWSWFKNPFTAQKS